MKNSCYEKKNFFGHVTKLCGKITERKFTPQKLENDFRVCEVHKTQEPKLLNFERCSWVPTKFPPQFNAVKLLIKENRVFSTSFLHLLEMFFYFSHQFFQSFL